MNLCDLPPELFRMIMTELVLTSVRVACKLRAVCRVFPEHIEEEILTKHPKETFRRCADRRHIIEMKNSRFLASKCERPMNYKTDLLDMIKKMAVYLVEEREIADAKERKKTRKGLIAQLCEGVSKTMSHPEVTEALWDEPAPRARSQEFFDACNKPLDASGKLMAAILTKHHLMVNNLLHEITDPSRHVACRSYLFTAVRLGDEDSVKLILRYLRGLNIQWRNNSTISDVYLVSDPSGFNMNDAICAAIAAEHEDILDHLLLFYATYMPMPKHGTYNA
jgi:hypothetical protein